MLSLWNLAYLLLAAPVAIAAPGAPSDISARTVPVPTSEDTSTAASASGIALPTTGAEPLRLAKCQQALRWTQFKLYSDTGCQNAIYDPYQITWDPCKSFSQIPELPNGVTFGSMRWSAGSHAQDFFACQQGHPCTSETYMIHQESNVCTSGGGARFDKIAILT